MRSNCLHALPTGRRNIVKCKLNLYGGQPHVAICRECPKRQDNGDTAANAPAPANTLAAAPPRTIRRVPPRRELDAQAKALAKTRAEVCGACEHNKGVTIEKNGWPAYVVKCGLCGCPGLSLVRGNCRAGKWQSQPAPSEVEARTPLLLRAHLSPGDVVMLTATVRDLHAAYPNRYVTAVETSAMDLWQANPHIVPAESLPGTKRVIDMQYPLINESNQKPYHFLHGYTQFLEQRLGVRIPVSAFKGDIHLAQEETQWLNQVEEVFKFRGSFWLIFAGGKYDFTAKWWSPEYYQQVVNHFQGRLQFVQCGESHHWHPQLKGVFNLVGKTSIRQLVRLFYHCSGVVCPVTFAMHLAAAVPTKGNRLRPCVVIAGGREPPHWEAYPGHQFLHTIGAFPCCATGGCWKSRCQTVGDKDPKDRENLCERPIQMAPELRIPQCMAMIQPTDVIRAIERYLALQ